MRGDIIKLSVSFLSSDNPLKTIEELNKTEIDYLHVDVTDGIFAGNYFSPTNLIDSSNKKLDIHLMVDDLGLYINKYIKYNPTYLTVHYENSDYLKGIKLIKENNIKAGISVNPSTKVEDITSILKDIDLVLVMSVKAGFGGQVFDTDIIKKIKYLKEYRELHNLNYKISVDGGINNTNINLLKDSDIVVIGSYITNGNIIENVKRIKGELDEIN